jgi:hypothetical protein
MNDTQTEGFDPQEAAELLDQATRQARSQFSMYSTLGNILAGIAVLVGFGAMWISVLGQHPYQGPALWALGVWFLLIVPLIIVTGTQMKRAMDGVSGPAQRQTRVGMALVGATLIASYVFGGALHRWGVSDAIGTGIYPAAGPIAFTAMAAAIVSAMQSEWKRVALALSVVVLGLVAAYTGPVAVWLVMGIGLFLVVVANEILTVRQLRA